ncbi:hypothetical protein KSF_098560 [Reticulibacter mediterranei]|uniref:Transposase IS116/IS110/IS902 C-terminal domain-containing protein n=1 Tax=Reticulibacter mediterranei TaxID=2778369 RepID=A0A8J3IWI5_9CHLR|nr:transposase [Reticulibacter mediterranei]GHO99808.1 hypothetical protein KSF_098560 [Reticulibacter mediterranei]
MLEAEICQIVEQSRGGQILISIPGLGPLAAATVIAVIGTIANFESAAAFKSYLGWAPKRAQSGTSFDRSSLATTGVRPTKQILYLVVCGALRKKDCEWARLYEHLLPRMCSYTVHVFGWSLR